MNCSIYLTDHTGHTSVSVNGKELTLEWNNTTLSERKELVKLVEDAMAKGYKPYQFNDSDIADEELDEKPTKSFFKRTGKLLFRGENVKAMKVICADLLDFELSKNNKLAFELKDDGSWELLTKGEIADVVKEDSSEEKPQRIKTSNKIKGG